ncbi:MAG: SRPBCC family protein [Candidatus Eremiobacteraeota bacterium]|nr:SRPBCC family protein [Candidatus Eremiobacteraeota bacterium]
MSSISTSATIYAPANHIFALARATERWPVLLPHYRFVRVISRNGDEKTIEMAARRGIFPVRWTAVQRDDASTPAIYFQHTAGWTKGMEVVWRFEERNGRTDVSIVHDIAFDFPIARAAIEKHLVGKFFIDGIASQTLARIKELAEDGNHA